MSLNDELIARAHLYAEQYGLTLGKELGSGVHGIVFLAESQAELGWCALKFHDQEAPYYRERDIYLRLKAHGVREIRGHHVPQLRLYDDDYLAIDMTVVQRPHILDFAGAYLDKPLDFSEEVMADWHADKLEQFEHHWPEVQVILAILETYGIFMEDVNPKNIAFAD